jgi:Fe-S-cluster-containing dehydrogenase component
MAQSRRKFLKTTFSAVTTLTGYEFLSKQGIFAKDKSIGSGKRYGVLVDTTVCIGCRRCEKACQSTHGLITGSEADYNDRSVYNNFRRPDENNLTVINEYINDSKITDVKVQCMHCNEPACVSACIVGAFTKKETGQVVWDGDKCIGCRYCMVACPFQIPAFEYQKAIEPEIRKCDFCDERQKEGLLPACVNICPVEALTFGTFEEILNLAKEKMRKYPERYFNYIYGENEVGGTSWIYISNFDLSKEVLPKLKEKPAPGISESIQHGIFAYFIPPFSLYALLGGIMWMTKKRNKMIGGKE